MDEFKFVLKCLIFSCLIVIFSQTRISGDTLENKAAVFFKYSETAQWVRAAADGGVRLIRQGADKTQNFISEKFGSGSTTSSRSYNAQPSQQQASRNTGLFRKLERKETAQQGEVAEPEYNQNDLTTEE